MADNVCEAQAEARRQWSLGLAYLEGQGVPQDKAKAARLFRRAADQGLADAQLSLGSAYFEG
jgi:TPR repeat protein